MSSLAHTHQVSPPRSSSNAISSKIDLLVSPCTNATGITGLVSTCICFSGQIRAIEVEELSPPYPCSPAVPCISEAQAVLCECLAKQRELGWTPRSIVAVTASFLSGWILGPCGWNQCRNEMEKEEGIWNISLIKALSFLFSVFIITSSYSSKEKCALHAVVLFVSMLWSQVSFLSPLALLYIWK